ncbi:DUF427-domain-containing protein [Leucogyrophana mollusca]|uniref:DUF427-domain-containing protein n=1 Tax=Leucogyrophana mollusca TaxID=85980 RepID=A0ACB8BKX1_9AGAM|nr:DUF427-domain-containing protein [Leucogyrophana mollusca]
MVQVTYKGTVLAESDSPVVVEGNYYFPPESVAKSVFKDSNTSSVCPWKGTAAYYSAEINGANIKDIAWYYPQPKEKASHIKNHVAFYKNKVDIVE